MVSTRSSTNTRRRDSNGVCVAAATTGSSMSSTRITWTPLGWTQVRSGCAPCITRRRAAPINVAFTQWAVLFALLFVTLPFVVRSVQPVLMELDREAEEASASLGAGPLTTFRRVILPALAPAIVSGAGLALGRALGEFGSVVLISGNLPFKTEVSS